MRETPHAPYFLALQALLDLEAGGHPRLVVDRARLAENAAKIRARFPSGRALRLVAKSLPSIPLLREAMALLGTQRLMVFHEPDARQLVEAFPEADLLFGKPMPIRAVARFYEAVDRSRGFVPARQVQWLVDDLARLRQLLELAERLGERLRVSLEIDVGLHRGGLSSPEALDPLLALVRQHPERLELAGLMGYDAHVGKLPSLVEREEESLRRSNDAYRAFVARLRKSHADLDREDLIFNGAGSPTFRLHDARSPLGELSLGSALLKPTDFDLPALEDLEPAAFIAAPVLKALPSLELPGPLPLGRLMGALDKGRRRAYFIYGGRWMAKPASPPWLRDNPLYGPSSNQAMLNGPERPALSVDDWVFFRPTQSEAVLQQFGEILAVDAKGHVERWAPFGIRH